MNNSIQKKKKKVLWEEANSSLGWKKPQNDNGAWKEARWFSEGQGNVGDVTWVPADMGGTIMLQTLEWHRRKYFTRTEEDEAGASSRWNLTNTGL